MMNKTSLIALSLLGLTAGAAQAQSVFGTGESYLALRGGVALLEDSHYAEPVGTDIANSYATGSNLSAAFGRSFGQGALFTPRAELEIGQQMAAIDSQAATTGGVTTTFSGAAADGKTSTTYGFANLYGDVAVAPGTAVFAGAGVGLGNSRFVDHSAAGTTLMDDSSTTFGYQGTVGLSLDLSNRLALEGSYRYQRFTDLELTAPSGATSSTDLSSNLFQGGLRLKF